MASASPGRPFKAVRQVDCAQFILVGPDAIVAHRDKGDLIG
jgi:hypothetical protein